MILGTCLLGLALAVSGVASQDKTDKDKGDPKPPDTKKKGQLPQGWKNLNLSKDQVQKIYDVQGDYKSKIKKLENDIKELRAKEHLDMVKVLTDSQKAELAKGLGLVDDKSPPKDKAPPKDDKAPPKDDKKDK